MKEYLYQALGSEKGIVLETDEPDRLIAKLHVARREAQDPTLKALIIARSRENPGTEIFIVRKQEKPSASEE